MPETAGGPRRVYVHIGVPKSGTTYVQEILAQNRAPLRRNGYLYPLPHREAMFHAAVDVRGTYDVWGLDRARTQGTWARLCQRIQEFEGDGILSHEILSAATPDQIAEAAVGLEGLEVHVVLTVRDLGRQTIATWQENIKNGNRSAFAEFEDRLVDDLRQGRRQMGFWRSQDVTAILERWSKVTSPERVHVVTGPPSGAPRDELWKRFCSAVGLDPGAYATELSRSANESLGAAQIAVLREVNTQLDGGIPQPLYAYVVKRLFAQRVLRNYPTRKLSYPESLYEPLRGSLGALGGNDPGRWLQRARRPLRPVAGSARHPERPHPDEVDAQEKYDVAKGAIADLLVELARQRGSGEPAPPPTPSFLRRVARAARSRRVAGGSSSRPDQTQPHDHDRKDSHGTPLRDRGTHRRSGGDPQDRPRVRRREDHSRRAGARARRRVPHRDRRRHEGTRPLRAHHPRGVRRSG